MDTLVLKNVTHDRALYRVFGDYRKSQHNKFGMSSGGEQDRSRLQPGLPVTCRSEELGSLLVRLLRFCRDTMATET